MSQPKPIIQPVSQYPTTCWECGSKLARRNQQRRYRHPAAKRRLFMAFVVTLICLPAAYGLGLGPLIAYDIRVRGIGMLAYLGFLFVVGTAPGGAIAKRALSMPLVIDYRCFTCGSQATFFKHQASRQAASPGAAFAE